MHLGDLPDVIQLPLDFLEDVLRALVVQCEQSLPGVISHIHLAIVLPASITVQSVMLPFARQITIWNRTHQGKLPLSGLFPD